MNGSQSIKLAQDLAKTKSSENERTSYPGLSNDSRSNLCFLNSVIQALASITDLYLYMKHWIKRLNESKPTDSPSDTHSIMINLVEIIEELNLPRDRKLIIRPTKFIESLVQFNSNSSRLFNSNQQDAHELMMMIIESVEDEIQRSIISSHPSMTTIGLAQLIHDNHTDTIPKDPSIILAPYRNSYISSSSSSSSSLNRLRIDHRSTRIPFRGLMANRIVCAACGLSAGIRHSPADHLSIHLPTSSVCTIEDCLKQYTDLELLDQYVCRKCTLVEAERKMKSELERISLSISSKEKKKKKKKKKSDGDNNGIPTTAKDQQLQEEGEEEEEEGHSSRSKSKRRLNKKIQDELQSHLSQISYAIQSDPDSQLDPLLENSLQSVWSPMTTKQTMFARPPDVLTFHLSRSTFIGAGEIFKNECRLIFPEILILDQFTTTSRLSGRAELPISRFTLTPNSTDTTTLTPLMETKGMKEKTKNDDEKDDTMASTRLSGLRFNYAYRLLSLIVHQGNHLSGHYLTFRRIPSTGTWFRVSDQDVDRCQIKEVLNSNPTLLLYQRLGHEDRF